MTIVNIDERVIFINGEESKYTVDIYGRIYSKYSNQYLKPFKNPNGYYLVDLYHNGTSYTRQVHRLVATAFIPNPSNLPTVNHIDGRKDNNTVENLEWLSIKDNVRHAWKTGLAKPRYGIDNPTNVYSEEQIHMVCALLELGKSSNRSIAEQCDVDVTLIRDIKFRGKWKHISCQYDINKTSIGHKELRQKIIDLMKLGLKNKEILVELRLPESQRRHIEYVRSIYNHSLNDYPEREYA